jgi:hypothetical protein
MIRGVRTKADSPFDFAQGRLFGAATKKRQMQRKQQKQVLRFQRRMTTKRQKQKQEQQQKQKQQQKQNAGVPPLRHSR